MKPDKKASEMNVKELAAYIDQSVLKPEFSGGNSKVHSGRDRIRLQNRMHQPLFPFAGAPPVQRHLHRAVRGVRFSLRPFPNSLKSTAG